MNAYKWLIEATRHWQIALRGALILFGLKTHSRWRRRRGTKKKKKDREREREKGQGRHIQEFTWCTSSFRFHHRPRAIIFGGTLHYLWEREGTVSYSSWESPSTLITSRKKELPLFFSPLSPFLLTILNCTCYLLHRTVSCGRFSSMVYPCIYTHRQSTISYEAARLLAGCLQWLPC